jgi:DNA (cytosine-5)-methyltransferase 1
MTYATAFSGVEGSGQGLEAAGFRQLWACEKDKPAASVIRYHYPDLPIYDDIQTIPAGEVAIPDILWGSPPCQDLSVAGKRKGLEGQRSGLFYDFITTADQLVRRGTRFVFMEQVPGLLSSNGGEDFRSVLLAFLDIGAVDVAWRVLDSQWFGVAQRRRRMFFAVDFGGECAGEILALAESLRGHPAPIREKGQVAPTLFASGAGTSRTASCATESEFLIPEVSGTLGCPKGGWSTSMDNSGAFIPEPVMVRWASEGGDTIQPIADTLRSEAEHNYQFVCESVSGDVAHALTSEGSDASEDGTGRGAPIVAFSCKDNGRDAQIRVTPTLRAMNYDHSHLNGGGQLAIAEFRRVRRLTPRECERLQGFPDDWTRWGVTEDGRTVEISDAQRYKMCGNAVTSTVPKWMAGNLLAAGVPT